MTILRNFCSIILLILFVSLESAAASISDNLIFKPALTVEYQIPTANSKNENDQFKNRLIEQQLKNFDNIVVGFNFRLHKYWGINANWSKFTLETPALGGYQLVNKASLNLKIADFTSVFYLPLVGDGWLEAFTEIGVTDINSRLSFNTASGTQYVNKVHETVPLYGVGLAVSPYDMDLVLRLGLQFYDSKLGSLHGNLIIWRTGIVKYF